MQQTMQAVSFRRYGPPDVLETLPVAVPAIPANGVLVRVAVAGLNPADWRFRNGQFRFIGLKLPFVPGTDIAGVVAAVGAAVTRFQPGDAVYTMLPTISGGGYAEYAVVAEENVACMPPLLSFVEAAGAPLAGLTALQALRDKARVQPGMRVLINGASGGVGTFAVQIAKVMGAHVTAVCSGRNTDLVRGIGADDVLDYTQGDVTKGTPRFDVIFDTQNTHSFRRWRRVLHANGTVVTVNPFIEKLSPAWLARFREGRRLRSIFVQPSGADLDVLSAWMTNGTLRPVIDRTYPLSEAAEAHRYSETQRVRGKLVLIVDEQLAASRGEALS